MGHFYYLLVAFSDVIDELELSFSFAEAEFWIVFSFSILSVWILSGVFSLLDDLLISEIMLEFEFTFSTNSRSSNLRCSIKKVFLEISQNSQENICARDLKKNLKKNLWHRCFPVNFAKFLRTPFLQSTSGRLLLEFGTYEFSLALTIKHESKPCTVGLLNIIFLLASSSTTGSIKFLSTLVATIYCIIIRAFTFDVTNVINSRNDNIIGANKASSPGVRCIGCPL